VDKGLAWTTILERGEKLLAMRRGKKKKSTLEGLVWDKEYQRGGQSDGRQSRKRGTGKPKLRESSTPNRSGTLTPASVPPERQTDGVAKGCSEKLH